MRSQVNIFRQRRFFGSKRPVAGGGDPTSFTKAHENRSSRRIPLLRRGAALAWPRRMSNLTLRLRSAQSNRLVHRLSAAARHLLQFAIVAYSACFATLLWFRTQQVQGQ